MSLSRLLDKIREQNMVKPLPKPKTRPETDEEFQYRAFHTPFYCEDCGSIIYPEWKPINYNKTTGFPVRWVNVQPCPKCENLLEVNMIYRFTSYTWSNADPENAEIGSQFTWHRGFDKIFRKKILIEDQTQTHHSDV